MVSGGRGRAKAGQGHRRIAAVHAHFECAAQQPAVDYRVPQLGTAGRRLFDRSVAVLGLIYRFMNVLVTCIMRNQAPVTTRMGTLRFGRNKKAERPMSTSRIEGVSSL